MLINKINQLPSNISTNQQLLLVDQIRKEVGGENILLDLLINRCVLKSVEPSYLDSIIFEFLFCSNNKSIQQKLKNYFPNGLINLTFDLIQKYQPLQNLLMTHQYKEADVLTQSQLCSLAGLETKKGRTWLYFTDVSLLPSDDLIVIDKLWCIYSRYKFGFSKQREIWISNNCNWEKFWSKIGWKNKGIVCRYPDGFLWNINAPSGHLPLFNQLRGVQVLTALFNHPVWNK